MQLMVNIDVPELGRALAFYTEAFGLTEKRRLGADVVELGGANAPIFLLVKGPGDAATSSGARRDYARHWTPIHLDFVVDDLQAAVARAVAAGAVVETPAASYSWGHMAVLADPFGHGSCLIQLTDAGYSALTLE